MLSSGFGHGSVVGGEGFLQEWMRRRMGCMCKKKKKREGGGGGGGGGWFIYGVGMPTGVGGG